MQRTAIIYYVFTPFYNLNDKYIMNSSYLIEIKNFIVKRNAFESYLNKLEDIT
jgi:hypothetical protein